MECRAAGGLDGSQWRVAQGVMVSTNESSIAVTRQAEFIGPVLRLLFHHQNGQSAFFEHFQRVTADKELA